MHESFCMLGGKILETTGNSTYTKLYSLFSNFNFFKPKPTLIGF